MTVAFNDAYTQYTGTGARTFFEFGFPVLEGSQVYVLVDGLPVVFIMQETGVVLDPAPALNAVIEIFRWTNVDQLADFTAFESFDADKTEDAVDKLIMLKQEGWFRGAMNLFADPKLDRVILINDKGDDAHILIWNEHTEESVVINDTGVFAGLVTQNMPCPGAVVEKPDHFAYFQWGETGPVTSQVFTTTIYPIEVIDGLQSVQGELLRGSAHQVVEEDLQSVSGEMIEGILKQVLLDFTIEPEALESISGEMIEGILLEILRKYTIPPEAIQSVHGELLSGVLENKLIQHILPEESLQSVSGTLISGTLT